MAGLLIASRCVFVILGGRNPCVVLSISINAEAVGEISPTPIFPDAVTVITPPADPPFFVTLKRSSVCPDTPKIDNGILPALGCCILTEYKVLLLPQKLSPVLLNPQ